MEKFTKDMLESGMHVVELRNGERQLYLNGSFIGQYAGEPLTSYNDDLTGIDYDFMDVVKIFQAVRRCCSLIDIINNPGTLVWERQEPMIIIPKHEALKKLAEVYGKEVKVEW